MLCGNSGPLGAKLVIVGEAPGADEESKGIPFVGWSGQELTRMLTDAGINRDEVLLTNVSRRRPPNNDIDHFLNPNKTAREGEVLYRDRWVAPHLVEDCDELHRLLKEVQPQVVLALGNTPLWALTKLHKKGEASVSKWRGSYLNSDVPGITSTIIPAYHPAYILRAWADRHITVRDFHRAREALTARPAAPGWRFETGADYAAITERLYDLQHRATLGPLPLVCDLEIKRGEIVCLGLAWSETEALCIPFYVEDPAGARRAFDERQTVDLWFRLWLLFSSPSVQLVNQNLPFDITFLFEDAGLWPKPAFDTMMAQHIMFPGEPKSLDYLASLYCKYYVYWKDDGKFWDKPIVFPQLWHYNCLDCVYTYEVYLRQQEALKTLGFEKQMTFQMDLMQSVLQMMFRGVLVDREAKDRVHRELLLLVKRLTTEANTMACMPLTGDKGGFSSAKLKDLFYTKLKLKPITRTKKGVTSVTCDDDALMRIGKAEPWLLPLTSRINQARSYATAVSATRAKVDKDGRWRCSYKMCGTENFRFSSEQNVFGTALNLQNLTLGKDIVK